MPTYEQRAIDGILLLDKPSGMTSNRALQKVKRLVGARKAGHTGSLDPLATGMLPICLGQATKVSRFLLDAPKRYRTVAKLGIATDTGDADGEVIESRSFSGVTPEALGQAVKATQALEEQVPPMYSALKKEGRRLYELARAGREVERSARPIKIYELTVVELEGDELTLEMEVSKGTYVRSVVSDLAHHLGTVAHVQALHRLAVGGFDGEPMFSLADLEAALTQSEGLAGLLLPVDRALEQYPRCQVDAETHDHLVHGRKASIPLDNPVPEKGDIRLYDEGGQFFGIGHFEAPGVVAPKRLFLDLTYWS